MNKLNSAFKSLECVDISQLNVEGNTEVAHSGADEPIQDNSLESDEEDDREPIVHTDVISERKRKNSAASSSDVSTTPRTRKKVKTAKTQSNTGFDKWKGVNYDEAFVNHCRELIAFKEEFGHCNVPHKFSNNQSLGHLCNNMISAYQKIQKGMKVDSNLPHDRIERLEDLASNGKS